MKAKLQDMFGRAARPFAAAALVAATCLGLNAWADDMKEAPPAASEAAPAAKAGAAGLTDVSVSEPVTLDLDLREEKTFDLTEAASLPTVWNAAGANVSVVNQTLGEDDGWTDADKAWQPKKIGIYRFIMGIANPLAALVRITTTTGITVDGEDIGAKFEGEGWKYGGICLTISGPGAKMAFDTTWDDAKIAAFIQDCVISEPAGTYTLVNQDGVWTADYIPPTVELAGKPRQHWPWNGLVDMKVKATGMIPERTYSLRITFITLDGRTIVYTKKVGWTGTESREETVSFDATKSDSGELEKELFRILEIKLEAVVASSEPAELGGVQLWENGPYWAECNLGAEKPKDYGYYYWWGDTVGYKRNAAGNGWVSSVDGETAISFSNGDATAGATYNKNKDALKESGYIDAAGNLNADHDAATVALGAPWRMPTDADFIAMTNYCTSVWTNLNGVAGYMVTGKAEGYTDKSIFLPAAGYGLDSGLNIPGSYGHYWSSTPYSDDLDYAWYLRFSSGNFGRNNYYRYGGRSVRPVRGSAE